MNINSLSKDALSGLKAELESEYKKYCELSLKLDLTRGKPSAEQLSLSNSLDGILDGEYTSEDGVDVRNYGGLEGLKASRQLGADVLGVSPEEVWAHGNSSLTLMFYTAFIAKEFGLSGKESAWKNSTIPIKFICPVPGYDRHFTVCQKLGIEMISVPMKSTGPCMDTIEKLISNDESIKGMWCVPKYSNPTGVVFSDETVERIAKLGQIAGKGFCVFWDNAYAVHDLGKFKTLANIKQYCVKHGTEDSVIQFASTSKISHAGSGVSFISMSSKNFEGFRDAIRVLTIGPDKVNQLRHLKLIPDYDSLLVHMKKHAAILRPRFETVLRYLEDAFGDNDLGTWEQPEGGYFISFDTRPGLAKEIVKLAGDAGVKLTPAGAPFPYRKDPDDKNIRIAPSVPTLDQLNQAMKVFVVCVKLAAARQQTLQYV